MPFSFIIATVDKTLFEGEIESLTVPGSAGEMTILAHHSALITTLKKGELSVRREKGGPQEKFPVEKGILEVAHNRAIVLI